MVGTLNSDISRAYNRNHSIVWFLNQLWITEEDHKSIQPTVDLTKASDMMPSISMKGCSSKSRQNVQNVIIHNFSHNSSTHRTNQNLSDFSPTPMPTLLIKTNVQTLGADAEDRIMSSCSSSIAELTGKPESFVMVSIESTKMIFGGSAEPCAFLVSFITHSFHLRFYKNVCMT